MATPRVTPELLARYDRPGPRYTSYPTAVEFTEGFGPAGYARHLDLAAARTNEPLSLYVHLPFCAERCTFCGCNVVITQDAVILGDYLDTVCAEIDLVAARLGERPKRGGLTQIHWGGGTPNSYAPAAMRRLHEHAKSRFALLPGAEIAIETDPRHCTPAHLDMLRSLGFNRLSMGVQDFDPAVQEAIGRGQTEAQTRILVEAARARGFRSINLDLIYGLPRQTPESFQKGIETLLDLRPERVALYSFALVPWKSHQQKRIEERDLPPADVKLALFAHALNALTAAGYAQVGMDHFALPTDELAIAQASGRLHRNFQGYTVKPPCDTVGVGISAIGDIQAAYAQNTKSLPAYAKAIGSGEFATERGIALSADDVIRRDWITRLMCNFGIDLAAFGRAYGMDPVAYFAPEWAELDDFDAEGFLSRTPERLDLTPLGRLFVRNVALVFDVHTRRRSGGKRVFSRTV